jgi:hypothetical protein
MTGANVHMRLAGIVIVAVLVCGFACGQSYDPGLLEGTWSCTTHWTGDNDGEAVPRSYVQQATLKLTGDNAYRASARAVLSIGAAQWDETVESTALLSGDQLHDTRITVETVPRNEAARQFEQERLNGQNLAIATKASELVRRFRITSLTEAEIVTVDDMGRISNCHRP